ncbi:MAG: InlB B-repeat-containing protein [Oscillospiraceae bacterium]|nr:InlB B-repeat-containing protein [Oscillospiraceae bacterium]
MKAYRDYMNAISEPSDLQDRVMQAVKTPTRRKRPAFWYAGMAAACFALIMFSVWAIPAFFSADFGSIDGIGSGYEDTGGLRVETTEPMPSSPIQIFLLADDAGESRQAGPGSVIDFGTLQGSEAAAGVPLTIENTSDQPTGPIHMALTGANPDSFRIAGAGRNNMVYFQSIDPGETMQTAISLSGDLAVGVHAALLTISADIIPAHSLELTVTVVDPEPEVTPTPLPPTPTPQPPTPTPTPPTPTPTPIPIVTASFQGNGGIPALQTIEVPIGTSFDEMAAQVEQPVRDGYEFIGWIPGPTVGINPPPVFSASWRAIELPQRELVLLPGHDHDFGTAEAGYSAEDVATHMVEGSFLMDGVHIGLPVVTIYSITWHVDAPYFTAGWNGIRPIAGLEPGAYRARVTLEVLRLTDGVSYTAYLYVTFRVTEPQVGTVTAFFYGNGGTPTLQRIEVPSNASLDEMLALAEQPTRRGYEFIGWIPGPTAGINLPPVFIARWRALESPQIELVLIPGRNHYFGTVEVGYSTEEIDAHEVRGAFLINGIEGSPPWAAVHTWRWYVNSPHFTAERVGGDRYAILPAEGLAPGTYQARFILDFIHSSGIVVHSAHIYVSFTVAESPIAHETAPADTYIPAREDRAKPEFEIKLVPEHKEPQE